MFFRLVLTPKKHSVKLLIYLDYYHLLTTLFFNLQNQDVLMRI